jgi:hypothetical protein
MMPVTMSVDEEEGSFITLHHRVKPQPSPAVVFARQYAEKCGTKPVDYRKLIARRSLEKRKLIVSPMHRNNRV